GDRDVAERLVLAPARLALLVELEQREERDGHGDAIGAADRIVERARPAAQRRRQRRRAEAMAVLVGQAADQVLGGPAVAARLEHARQQLLGRLAGLEIE